MWEQGSLEHESSNGGKIDVTVTDQTLLSMEFSRQEYWSGLPFPSPEDLLYPGIEPGSPTSQADALPSEPPGKPYCLFKEDNIKLWGIYVCIHLIRKL